MTVKIVTFELNGRAVDVVVKPLTTLQTVLREQLGYTATKAGCRQGGCGSCAVLVEGEPVLSCILPVENVAGQQVTTLEGLMVDNHLNPIQESFFEEFATQCGYCTPGMIIVAKALLDHKAHPSREEIVEALTGNFCRCTGYEPIIHAIQKASMRIGERDLQSPGD
jgi:carbon-monoxide dehydrogenase small subunit